MAKFISFLFLICGFIQQVVVRSETSILYGLAFYAIAGLFQIAASKELTWEKIITLSKIILETLINNEKEDK